jgi:hypothetical protein
MGLPRINANARELHEMPEKLCLFIRFYSC